MRLHNRHRWYWRSLSGMLVLFFLTASGRALVPGLCATLSSMEACAIPVEDEKAQDGATCCHAPSSNSHEGTWASAQQKHPQCAFCHLAHATTDLQHDSDAIRVGVSGESQPCLYEAPYFDGDKWQAISLRAPPSLLV